MVDSSPSASRKRFLSDGQLGTTSGLTSLTLTTFFFFPTFSASFFSGGWWCLLVLALGGHLARQVHGTELVSQGFLVRCNTGSRVVGK